MTLPVLRSNRRAFSSFYGAMGVLLVSSALVGLLLLPHQDATPNDTDERRLADEYLDVLLRSTVANRTTLSQALAYSCFTAPCANGTWNASALKAAVSAIAAPLARALERNYSVAVTADGLTQLRVGNLPLDSKGAAATAEVFRPRDGSFLGISVLLSVP